jgi:hypothetical protein
VGLSLQIIYESTREDQQKESRWLESSLEYVHLPLGLDQCDYFLDQQGSPPAPFFIEKRSQILQGKKRT